MEEKISYEYIDLRINCFKAELENSIMKSNSLVSIRVRHSHVIISLIISGLGTEYMACLNIGMTFVPLFPRRELR